jgi:hypothetical protein
MSQIIISHSEVDSLLLCRQRHFYAFGDKYDETSEKGGLEPREFSDALYRGIVGHKGLEMFYKTIEADGTTAEALNACISAVQAYSLQPNPKYDILTDLSVRILPNYVAQVAADMLAAGWKVKAVEHTYMLEIPTQMGNMVYPFTPDLIMRSPDKRNVVIDHKFLYNFYNQSEIDLLPQIPKYMAALKALGLPIHYGMYNMLRWRAVRDQSIEANFRQREFEPTPERLKHAFLLQVRGMERIATLKAKGTEAWRKEVDLDRVQNGMICKSCPFKRLCATEMSGGDATLMRKLDFQVNSYGYSEKVVDE